LKELPDVEIPGSCGAGQFAVATGNEGNAPRTASIPVFDVRRNKNLPSFSGLYQRKQIGWCFDKASLAKRWEDRVTHSNRREMCAASFNRRGALVGSE
jgi:hypothetical protein